MNTSKPWNDEKKFFFFQCGLLTVIHLLWTIWNPWSNEFTNVHSQTPNDWNNASTRPILPFNIHTRTLISNQTKFNLFENFYYMFRIHYMFHPTIASSGALSKLNILLESLEIICYKNTHNGSSTREMFRVQKEANSDVFPPTELENSHKNYRLALVYIQWNFIFSIVVHFQFVKNLFLDVGTLL